MNPISYLWSHLPESGTKERLRALAHSRQSSAARFSFRRGVFRTDFEQTTLRTSDHPFLLPVYQKQYQSRHQIKEGEVIVDAGAYNGHLSLYFGSMVGDSGMVISIEPDKANLQLVRENLKLNPTVKNVFVVETILWDGIDSVEFCEQGTGASSAFWMPSEKPRTRKETTTLDNIVRDMNLSRLDFIKMDIEGAEVKALAGAQETIERFKPDFAIASYHIADGAPTLDYVERTLRHHQYDVETIFFGKECITFGTAPRGKAD